MSPVLKPSHNPRELEWLEDVPSHWEIKAIKHHLKADGYKAGPFGSSLITSNLSNEGEVVVLTPEHVSKGEISLDGNQFLPDERMEEMDGFRVSKGDVVIPIVGTLGKALVVKEEIPAIINQRLARISPDPAKILPEYLSLLLTEFSYFKTLDEVESKGAILSHITKDKILNRKLPSPPVEEQEAILRFLSLELQGIDELMAEKDLLLNLLEEKRIAMISRAVTRGLDPKATTKPSGVDWLGEIPKRWQIERGKNLFSVRDERSEEGEEELLTVSHITGVTSRAEKEVYMFKADDMTGYKRCMKDDFVTNTLWAWMGAMGVSPLDGIVSPDYHVYTSKGQIIPEFMELLCRSKPFVAEVTRWSKGVWSSRLRLYPENFFEIRLPVPPKTEQEEIVAAIAAYKEKTSELVDALLESIKLLKERRSALITAAVTGQFPLEEMTA